MYSLFKLTVLKLYRLSSCMIITTLFMMTISGTVAEASKKMKNPDVEIIKNNSEELTADSFFDISLLTSRAVYYALEGVQHIEKNEIKLSKEAISKSLNMLSVLKVISPVTTVDMTIKDDKGLVFKDEQEIVLTEIPIFEWMTQVKVIQPVIRYKNKFQTLEQLPVIQQTILTQLWVDVDYLERGLEASMKQLNTSMKKQAHESLKDAVLLSVRIDTPEFGKNLKKAIQHLLRAYWYAISGKNESAVKSLGKAKRYIQLYAKNERLTEDPDVKSLIDEINQMEASVKTINSETIKRFWFKIIKRSLPI